MELRRQLGVSYPTGWKIKHKLMQAIQEREGQNHLQGIIHVDDAYFGGEINGGKAGRGSENKVPFVAAIELNEEGRPIRIKMDRVGGFTSDAIRPGPGRGSNLVASFFLMGWPAFGPQPAQAACTFPKSWAAESRRTYQTFSG